MRHEVTLDSQRRPDYIFIKISEPDEINLLYACFMVELMVGKSLDKKHMGKLMLYNEDVLNANPSREFIISVLTNLNDMLLLKSEVCTNDNAEYEIKHTFSKHMNFWKHGVKYIRQLHNLPITAGYDDDKNFSIEISDGYLFSIIGKYPILYTLFLFTNPL